MPDEQPDRNLFVRSDQYSFVRTGIPLTIIAYLLILAMGATYWKWLGYMA